MLTKEQAFKARNTWPVSILRDMAVKLLVVVLFAVCLCSSCTSSEADPLYLEAKNLAEESKYLESLATLSRVVEVDPSCKQKAEDLLLSFADEYIVQLCEKLLGAPHGNNADTPIENARMAKKVAPAEELCYRLYKKAKDSANQEDYIKCFAILYLVLELDPSYRLNAQALRNRFADKFATQLCKKANDCLEDGRLEQARKLLENVKAVRPDRRKTQDTERKIAEVAKERQRKLEKERHRQQQAERQLAQAKGLKSSQLTAVSLYEAYEDNEFSADSMYKGKILRVYGRIAQLGRGVRVR